MACSNARAHADPDAAKATLFCPSCGHEAPWDDDWVVTTGVATREVRCPCCGTVVA